MQETSNIKIRGILLYFPLFFLLPITGRTQVIQYSPNPSIQKTVAQNYYDTEYLFIKNIGKGALSLAFELLENEFKAEWSATFCTNVQCFNKVPSSGSLGTIEEGQEAYISLNFAANETVGQGKIRVLVTSPQQPNLKDTVTFDYTVTEDGSIKAGPWANINYGQGVLTVLLENPHLETTMMITDLNGKIIYDDRLDHITSIPLRNYPKGMYIIGIRDENDRIIRKKVIHF